jgi:hypothetical protein
VIFTNVETCMFPCMAENVASLPASTPALTFYTPRRRTSEYPLGKSFQ